VPIFGLELQERQQTFLKDKLRPYAVDLEAWHTNLQGLADFMRFLIDEGKSSSPLFISGACTTA
jgi:hypothetical protein